MDGTTIAGESKTWARIGDDGSKVIFHFCPTCGSTVYHLVEGYDEGSIAIPVGAFADASFSQPTFSVCKERMHSWGHLPEGMEHMR